MHGRKPEDFVVLVVDDEKEICSAIQELLQIQGWNVLTSNNGCEALKVIETTKVDIVISDIRMPKCTGYDMLMKLSDQQKERLTIIMMSAYSDYDEEELIRLGAKKQLSKPINGRQLSDYIKELINQ